MNKPIYIETIQDHAAGDRVYQTTSYQMMEGQFCDCCEDQIKEGQNIGANGHDFCAGCYLSGGINRYFRQELKWKAGWILKEMEIIKTNYEKLKK